MDTKRAYARQNEWARETYDRIPVNVPKGMREKIREFAASKGMSVNGFINELIQKEMEEK